jgi:carbonic anhydrase
MPNRYKALVLSCIDPRFQPLIYRYLKKRKLEGCYSSFTIAGGAVGVTDLKFKGWHNTFWDNLSTSIELHKIDTLIVINHRDCGAAKIANNNDKFNEEIEEEIHIKSFKKIKESLKERHPNLSIELNLMSLDETVKRYE